MKNKKEIIRDLADVVKKHGLDLEIGLPNFRIAELLCRDLEGKIAISAESSLFKATPSRIPVVDKKEKTVYIYHSDNKTSNELFSIA